MTNLTNGCKITTAQESIITFLEAMNQDSEAVQNCKSLLSCEGMNSHDSVYCLEDHFRYWLWVDSPTWVGYDEGERAYALELGRIEMEMVLNGWIYDAEEGSIISK